MQNIFVCTAVMQPCTNLV